MAVVTAVKDQFRQAAADADRLLTRSARRTSSTGSTVRRGRSSRPSMPVAAAAGSSSCPGPAIGWRTVVSGRLLFGGRRGCRRSRSRPRRLRPGGRSRAGHGPRRTPRGRRPRRSRRRRGDAPAGASVAACPPACGEVPDRHQALVVGRGPPPRRPTGTRPAGPARRTCRAGRSRSRRACDRTRAGGSSRAGHRPTLSASTYQSRRRPLSGRPLSTVGHARAPRAVAGAGPDRAARAAAPRRRGRRRRRPGTAAWSSALCHHGEHQLQSGDSDGLLGTAQHAEEERVGEHPLLGLLDEEGDRVAAAGDQGAGGQVGHVGDRLGGRVHGLPGVVADLRVATQHAAGGGTRDARASRHLLQRRSRTRRVSPCVEPSSRTQCGTDRRSAISSRRRTTIVQP